MAQDLKPTQPVRLPNPSAQPFVAALRTARLFAVVFFWITMVSVLLYVVAFVLMLRFFESFTQTQIAERVGISQMHVSRLLAKSLHVLYMDQSLRRLKPRRLHHR